jgi:hypothetical protein
MWLVFGYSLENSFNFTEYLNFHSKMMEGRSLVEQNEYRF